MTDVVNHPPHYMLEIEGDEVEAKNIIKAVLIRQYGEEGFKAYCHGNMLKYLLRDKEDMEEDVAKTGKYSSMYNE